MKHHTVPVTAAQFQVIQKLCAAWQGEARRLLPLEAYLIAHKLPILDATNLSPGGYKFLAGGITHIAQRRKEITVYDRGIYHNNRLIVHTTTFRLTK